MSRLAYISKIIPNVTLHIEKACDAASDGMDGVHFIPMTDNSCNNNVMPILWQQRFPQSICNNLVSYDNPNGRITNSNLKLAGLIAHNDILAQYADVSEATTHNCYNNTPTVFWQIKGAVTSVGPAAFLLWLQGLHQRYHQYVPL